MGEKRFPNESDDYRAARAELLKAENELRAQLERVAAKRRQLPAGGSVKEDYVFEELVDGSALQVRLSELFTEGQDQLLIYNFMYGPKSERPCPMCNSLLDGLDAQAQHITQRVSFAVVARSPIARIHEHAETRGWKNLRLLSSSHNSYNADYFGEDSNGNQMPMANVFARSEDGVRHFWGSELLYAGRIEDGDTRHVDMLWPVWNFFDLTPGGRAQWYPKLSY